MKTGTNQTKRTNELCGRRKKSTKMRPIGLNGLPMMQMTTRGERCLREGMGRLSKREAGREGRCSSQPIKGWGRGGSGPTPFPFFPPQEQPYPLPFVPPFPESSKQRPLQVPLKTQMLGRVQMPELVLAQRRPACYSGVPAQPP